MKFKPLILSLAVLALLIGGCKKAAITPLPLVPVAKAPSDTTITLPLDSLTLSGKSGIPTDIITGYLWSQVSGPNEAAIYNESSPSASFKKLIEGKYIFQFMVIDNKGLSAVDTFSVTVKAPVITTLNLSPSNNPFESNIALLGTQDASNHTSIEEPLAAWTINYVPVTVRNLLKFDMSSIPANATILSADLYLFSDTIPKNGDLVHANYGTDNSVVIQQVASAWDSSTLTWFNQPEGLTANQVIVPSTPLPFLNIDVNIKDIVSSMVSSNTNYGFKLSLQNEIMYTSRIFCSSYYSDVSRHPRLVVKYVKN